VTDESIRKLINQSKLDLILKNSKKYSFIFFENNEIKTFWINLSYSRLPACDPGHNPNQV
jgi:hypothetical protein